MIRVELGVPPLLNDLRIEASAHPVDFVSSCQLRSGLGSLLSPSQTDLHNFSILTSLGSINYGPPLSSSYRAWHLPANMGLVDFDLGCSTVSPTISATSANFPSAQAKLGRGGTAQMKVNATQVCQPMFRPTVNQRSSSALSLTVLRIALRCVIPISRFRAHPSSPPQKSGEEAERESGGRGGDGAGGARAGHRRRPGNICSINKGRDGSNPQIIVGNIK